MCTLIFALRIMLFLGNLLKRQVSATRILMTAFTMVLVLNLQRVIPEVITASFELRLFHYLHISALEKRHVVEPIDCSFACLRNAFCVSLNVAAVADGKGKYWCELLSSNIHSDAAKLAANYQSHHYSLSQVFEKWLDLSNFLSSSTETKITKKPEVFCCLCRGLFHDWISNIGISKYFGFNFVASRFICYAIRCPFK